MSQCELMAVTVQGPDVDLLLPKVRSSVDEAVSARHLSPTKYLAIAELQRIDPSATTENCRDHSISELRQSAHDHAQGHEAHGAAPHSPASPSTTNGAGSNPQSDDHHRGTHH